MPRQTRTLPFAPIYQLAVADAPPVGIPRVVVAHAYRKLGITRFTAARYRNTNLDPYTADRLAIACGMHPSEVWGDEWWAA